MGIALLVIPKRSQYIRVNIDLTHTHIVMLPPPHYTNGLPPEISNRVKDRISIYYPSLGRVDQQIQHPLGVQLVAQKKGAATRVYHAF